MRMASTPGMVAENKLTCALEFPILRSASVISLADIKLIKIYNHDLDQATESCQRHFEKAFLELLANRLAEVSEQINKKEKSRAKLSDASPTGKPETMPDNIPLPDASHSPCENPTRPNASTVQKGCSCLVSGRNKAIRAALIGLVIFDVLRYLFSLLS